jgi:hypothetical protein
MNKKMLALVVLSCLFSVTPNVKAASLTLTINKQTFQLHDTIKVNATLSNNGAPENVTLEYSLRDLRGKIMTALNYQKAGLKTNEVKNVSLYNLLIDESFYSGTYIVSVSTIEGAYRTQTEEIQFNVEGLAEDMNIKIVVSSTRDLASPSLFFMKNEKVYIGFKEAPNGTIVEAEVTLPDNSTITKRLPMNITAKVVGTYQVKAMAKAQGYRNTTLTRLFGVLEKEPSIIPTEKQASELILTPDKTEIKEGETITLTGGLTPAHAQSTITINYIKDGKTESTKNLTTNDEGKFTDTYKPTAGTWSITAKWSGDSNHQTAQTTKNFTVAATQQGIPGFPAPSMIIGLSLTLIYTIKKHRT